MTGGFAAAQVVIVHAWHVVMNQRIGVYQFDRGGWRIERGILGVHYAPRGVDEAGANPFAAVQRRIAHGLVQPLWRGRVGREKAIKCALDTRAQRIKVRVKIHGRRRGVRRHCPVRAVR